MRKDIHMSQIFPRSGPHRADFDGFTKDLPGSFLLCCFFIMLLGWQKFESQRKKIESPPETTNI